MMSHKVSIILPVYNAINYINKTIDSIVNQTYRNFELIIIDDGATDGTSEVCREYSECYQFIRYEKQQNAGVCAARNKGISIASGEYIAFSDHDDEYLPDYLEKMVVYMSENDLDIVKCGVFFEEEYADRRTEVREEKFTKHIITRDTLVENYCELPVSYFGVWNSLYRLSMLKQSKVLFPEYIKHGQEDYFFNTEIIPYIKRIGFIDDCLYKHFRRLSQSTSSKFYSDRVYHMGLYFKTECEVFSSLMDRDWTMEYGILYARKITGILSYTFATIPNCTKSMVATIINEFCENNPLEKRISVPTWIRILVHNSKYALVLLLLHYKKYNILVDLWKRK